MLDISIHPFSIRAVVCGILDSAVNLGRFSAGHGRSCFLLFPSTSNPLVYCSQFRCHWGCISCEEALSCLLRFCSNHISGTRSHTARPLADPAPLSPPLPSRCLFMDYFHFFGAVYCLSCPLRPVSALSFCPSYMSAYKYTQRLPVVFYSLL